MHNSRTLRDGYLCTYIVPSREDVRNKLRQILRMTKFGDWLMFYLLAHNMDKATSLNLDFKFSILEVNFQGRENDRSIPLQVNFTELIDMGVMYPGYRDTASQWRLRQSN